MPRSVTAGGWRSKLRRISFRSATLRESWVHRTVGAGIFVYASALDVETTAVTDVTPEPGGRYGSALTVTGDPVTTIPSLVHVWGSLFTRSGQAGIVMVGSELTVDQCELSTIAPDGLGTYGDGILAFGTTTSEIPGSLSLSRSRVAESARAGVACFGATVSVATSVLACHPYALDAEELAGRPCELQDAGGNVCGCEPLSGLCKAVSSSLQPPGPVGDPYQPDH